MNRPDGTITSETRVTLLDCNKCFICMWIGYKLPENMATYLDNEKRYPNLNNNALYSLNWYYEGEPYIWPIQTVGMPLGIAIQIELASLARLG